MPPDDVGSYPGHPGAVARQTVTVSQARQRATRLLSALKRV